MSTFMFAPRRGPHEFRMAQTSGAHRLFRSMQSVRYTALMDSGLVPDPDEVESRLTGGGVAAAAAAPSSMFQALRRIVPYQGTKHTAATMIFGPQGSIEHDVGMPAHEASVYIGSGRLQEDLIKCIASALESHGSPHAPHIRLRIDLTYTTRPAQNALRGGGLTASRRAPMMSSLEDSDDISVPHIYRGHDSLVMNTPGSIASVVNSYVSSVSSFMDETLPSQDSNSSLDSIVSAHVWATPSLSVSSRIGGSTRFQSVRGKAVLLDRDALPSGQIDGAFVVPHELVMCRGLVANDPSRGDDLRCLPRAIMTGLDFVHEARSDANLVVILSDALGGATQMLVHAQRLASVPALVSPQKARASSSSSNSSSAGASVGERRAELVRIAQARVDDLRAQLKKAIEMFEASKRHVRTRGDGDSDMYRSRARYGSIERELQSATRGTHALIDFRDPCFSTSMPINAETVKQIRACVKPGARVKLQFFTVGTADKVVLVYPDEGATFDFLAAGGRVVNIFYGYKHASYLADVGAACNHKPLNRDASTSSLRAGKGKDRCYCGLCGFHVSNGTIGAKYLVFEHQLAGCQRSSSTEMTAPLSDSNRRQLSKQGFAALERSAMTGFYATESDTTPTGTFVAREASLLMLARTPGGWGVYPTVTDPYFGEWVHLRNRYRNDGEVVASYIPVPRGDIRTYGSGSLRPEQALWFSFASPQNVDAILAQLHWVCPKDAASRAALAPLASNPLCRGCRLPVTGPTVWRLQAEAAAAAAGAVAAALSTPVSSRLALGPEALEDALDASQERADAEEMVEASADEAAFADEGGHCEGGQLPVEHHCHATGRVHWAHAACNTYIRRRDAVTIDVASAEAMSAAVSVLFSRQFIESFCFNARPPVLCKRADTIQRITFYVCGSPRTLSHRELEAKRDRVEARGGVWVDSGVAEFTPRVLSVTLRARACFLEAPTRTSPPPSKFLLVPSARSPSSARVLDHANELVEWAEREFEVTGLWPLAFTTRIAYGRNLLLRTATTSNLGPGITPTSLTDEATLQSLKRMTTGGIILLGRWAERFPLREPLCRRTVRLNLDTTAAYPSVFLTWKVPLLEHADARVHDFSTDVVAGVAHLRACDLDASVTTRYEVWGHFPAELHASLRDFPPVTERREVFAKDLSVFQRKFMRLDPTASLGERTVNHLWPIHGLIVFARTAKMWLALGFCFVRIGRVWETPCAPWGFEWARVGEERRRRARGERLHAATREDEAAWAAEEDSIKQTYNAVTGSLNMNTDNHRVFISEKNYVPLTRASAEHSVDRLSVMERYADNERFSMQVLLAADTLLFEMRRKRIKHTQSTLAALFVMEMARCDMMELWYGTRCGGRKGILDAFPSAHLIYGCTDSLMLELSVCDDEGVGLDAGVSPASSTSTADLRCQFWEHFASRMDLSNVPATSTFWNGVSEEVFRSRFALAGKWGCLKEVTGFAGVNAVVIHRPNCYGYGIVDSETDTPPKLRGKGGKVIKSVPTAWQEGITLEQFAASWYCEDRLDVSCLPALPTRVGFTDALDATVKSAPRPRELALWGNKSCVVSRTPPYGHFPLGSKEHAAYDLVQGLAW